MPRATHDRRPRDARRDNELDLLAGAGARVCICPTTEADLGDGYAPLERLLERGIEICIGSDSNVRVDPFEELRSLDGIARREALRRDVLSPDALLEIGGLNGAGSLGIERWRGIEIDLGHEELRGVAAPDLRSALLAGGSAAAVKGPRELL